MIYHCAVSHSSVVAGVRRLSPPISNLILLIRFIRLINYLKPAAGELAEEVHLLRGRAVHGGAVNVAGGLVDDLHLGLRAITAAGLHHVAPDKVHAGLAMGTVQRIIRGNVNASTESFVAGIGLLAAGEQEALNTRHF